MKTAALLAALVAVTACASRAPQAPPRVVDLSYDFSDQTVYWPTADPFVLQTVAEGRTDKGFYYSAYKFSAAEHGGTHIDAPIHFAESHQTVDQIPLDHLMGPAVKVDVTDKALADRDYLVSVADLTAWEQAHGRIPDGSILLIQTGYGKYWPDRKAYLGTDKRGPEGVAELHFPGLDPEAAGRVDRSLDEPRIELEAEVAAGREVDEVTTANPDVASVESGVLGIAVPDPEVHAGVDRPLEQLLAVALGLQGFPSRGRSVGALRSARVRERFRRELHAA